MLTPAGSAFLLQLHLLKALAVLLAGGGRHSTSSGDRNRCSWRTSLLSSHAPLSRCRRMLKELGLSSSISTLIVSMGYNLASTGSGRNAPNWSGSCTATNVWLPLLSVLDRI